MILCRPYRDSILSVSFPGTSVPGSGVYPPFRTGPVASHRRCVVIPAQAIGLGCKEPTLFRRAESPIYLLFDGEGWIGPTALTNSRLLKPRPSAWAGITTHLRCWYSLMVYANTAN